jgi:flagellum-specific ATP synthase
MLRLNVARLKQAAGDCNVYRTVGTLHSVRGLLRCSLPAFVGEICELRLSDGSAVSAEVVGFEEQHSQLMCYDEMHGLRPGMDVIGTGRSRSVPVGIGLLGRVIDGLGRPLDGRGALRIRAWRSDVIRAPNALRRQRITQPLVTGQRVIDGLLTIGLGQRIGLFAGSGVGKSTLLGEIARVASADLNVIVLVGERGREVVPFLEDCLGPLGRERSVVVLATSDQPPLMRIRAVTTGITIAEEFRRQGQHVLMFVDSLTRLALAQRELGLLRGEPPGVRGYPPSVQTVMAELLERMGTDERGSITGIISVLVEGDDHDEPIADAARAILDGHIVLDRELAARGHFPAVNVMQSVSRLFRELIPPEQLQWANHLRGLLAAYYDVEDLIRIGAYQPGTSAQIDHAIRLMPHIEAFLRQDLGERSPLEQTRLRLRQICENGTDGSAGGLTASRRGPVTPSTADVAAPATRGTPSVPLATPERRR